VAIERLVPGHDDRRNNARRIRGSERTDDGASDYCPVPQECDQTGTGVSPLCGAWLGCDEPSKHGRSSRHGLIDDGVRHLHQDAARVKKR